MPGTCACCGTHQRWRLRWFTCPDCQATHLCARCIDNPVLSSPRVPASSASGGAAATAAAAGARQVVRSVCRACLERASSLDFSSSVDVVGPAAGAAPAVVFVHGGGGCRLMYAHQARALAARGYRCVLLDLPAHGALLDTPLTIDSACERIAAVTRELAPPHAGVAPAYVGGSLGGYLGMELLGREPALFSCAVIGCASQTVGVGAGCMARAALVAMKASLGVIYGETVLRQMLKVMTARPELRQDLLQESVFGPSMFFQRTAEQVAVLRQSDPLAALPRFRGPVLFADGSKDHHDNRAKLLAVAQASNPRSRAVVYEGADHFFSHDQRFCAQHIDDIDAFVRDVLGEVAAPVAPATAAPAEP